MSNPEKQKISGLRFECTGCGACCTGDAGHYVEIGHADQDAVRSHLNISRRWFRRRYLTRVDENVEGIRLNPDGRCPFLDSTNHCRIYPVRPLQCRTYPWWPELLNRRASWTAEARRCEGIGRGAVVAVATIERALHMQTRTNRSKGIPRSRQK
ncbi:MAG: YkgJ family cysteine cluster protein [Acidiferrobacterales bacterium]